MPQQVGQEREYTRTLQQELLQAKQEIQRLQKEVDSI
jgi:hypothetical protein